MFRLRVERNSFSTLRKAVPRHPFDLYLGLIRKYDILKNVLLLAVDTSMKAHHSESGRDKLGRDKSGREKPGRDEAVVSQKSARSKSIIPTVKSSAL